MAESVYQLQFRKTVNRSCILTIPSRRHIIHRPISLRAQLHLLVHAARNLMQEQDFCHKVSLNNFARPNFWPDGSDRPERRFQGIYVRSGMQAKQSFIFRRLRSGSIMWHNTQPIKGIRTIRHMNEHSFTFLLASPPDSIGRTVQKISSRFATATWEGLCGLSIC